jgi:aminoglycoside 2'-N-acetyltransferase I
MRVIQHADLSGDDITRMRYLFDREYLAEFGSWTPEAPYGYSPADVHTLVFDGAAVVAHVGFQVRVIKVGGHGVPVAGTGGVLVDARHRGTNLGRQTMQRAQQAMREDSRVEFGYLGCRQEVVPFYESTGWRRVQATERHISRLDRHSLVTSTGEPILVYPLRQRLAEWPPGVIDLLGTPW